MSKCNDYPINSIDAELFCRNCGREITSQSKTGLCHGCYHASRRVIFEGSRCTVDGCDKQVKARGLCPGHLHKLQRYGAADLPNRKEQDGRMNHPLYYTWKGMRSRCNNPNFKQFADYGGRGIEVCERWDNVNDGFWNFVDDMGERPDGYSLDRIDSDGGYCPENCVWSDRLTQNNNTRRTKYAEHLAVEDPESVEIYPAIIISTPDGDRTIKIKTLDDMLSRLERLKYV